MFWHAVRRVRFVWRGIESTISYSFERNDRLPGRRPERCVFSGVPDSQ
jgi:hypothetical protein